jgi:ferredoxin
MMAPQATKRAQARLAIDWTVCDGRGLCAELLPELVERDDWGFPVISEAAIAPELLAHAKRAVASCPTLALRLPSNT